MHTKIYSGLVFFWYEHEERPRESIVALNSEIKTLVVLVLLSLMVITDSPLKKYLSVGIRIY